MGIQERLIALDRLISLYKPQGVNTIVLESERDRLTVQLDQERRLSQSSQNVSSEIYQLSLQKAKEGRFVDALSAIRKAERLVPEDKTFGEMRRKLEAVTAIVPSSIRPTKADRLVRTCVVHYLENDGPRALNAVIYANQISASQTAQARLQKLMEKEFPGNDLPPLPAGKTLVDYKMQLALEYVYDSKYLKAIEECNQVLDLEPNHVLALTRMGSAYYAMGQREEARGFWTKALSLDPDNQMLRNTLKGK
jgi:tetratricopeptide (TPR) repeat protein